MRFILLFIFNLYCLPSSGQKAEEYFDFSISFAACFDNDSVGLQVNGKTLICSQRITTDPLSGITYLGTYQDKKALWVTKNGIKKQQFPLLVNNKMAKLNIMFNGKWTEYNVDLEKGKIIFINACFIKGTKQEMTIKQFKETVLLD